MRHVPALVLVLLLSASAPALAGPCTHTDFVRDGVNLTAALINPDSVTGTVDATGCDIGVYYGPGSRGVINGAEIFGADYFGVVANGDAGPITVDIVNSAIHDIGMSPHNGMQRGIGIYLRAYTWAGAVTSRIMNNQISGYQKGGIVANGINTQVVVDRNTVAGDGHVDFIAMNGIQIGYGAAASVTRNSVSGNSYSGADGVDASGGIIVVGGPGYGVCPDGNACPYTLNTRVTDNVLAGNDVGVWLTNLAEDFSAPATATNVKAINNTIVDNECFNMVYQAAVSDVGNNDKMIANTVSGGGYVFPCGIAVDADTSFTNRPKVHATK